MVNILVELGIEVYFWVDVLGVYVGEKKICLLGLCIWCGCLFYGLVLNVNMDFLLFLCINFCGYVGMEMVKIL